MSSSALFDFGHVAEKTDLTLVVHEACQTDAAGSLGPVVGRLEVNRLLISSSSSKLRLQMAQDGELRSVLPLPHTNHTNSSHM